MEDARNVDLDQSTAQAWRRFQTRLADHLIEMEEDDLLLVEADSTVGDDEPGAAPYIQVCAWGDHMLRGEVVSNHYLAQAHQLDPQAEEDLVELGFSRPSSEESGSSNFFVDLPQREADRLSVMSTAAMREVFRVVHPAFLHSDDLPEDGADGTGHEVLDTDAMLANEDIASYAKSQEHLQELVDAALTPFFGHPPNKDDDGDIPVVNGTSVVFVRVLRDMPVIDMFANVVDQIAELDRAAFEVSVLNRDSRFVKYVLRERMIQARVSLPASPFAPEHLRSMLSMMCEAVDEADDDLAVRLKAKRFLEPEPEATSNEEDREGSRPDGQEPDDEDPFGFAQPLREEAQPTLFDDVGDQDDESEGTDEQAPHPAMQTLLELEAESPRSVEPELAAGICEFDRALILDLIRWNSDQEIAWRQSRDEALVDEDPDLADVREDERAHSERIVRLLRRALRVTVERQARSLEGATRRSVPPKPRRSQHRTS